jgi:hypothetical protein
LSGHIGALVASSRAANRSPAETEGQEDELFARVRRQDGNVMAPARPGWSYLRADRSAKTYKTLLVSSFSGLVGQAA